MAVGWLWVSTFIRTWVSTSFEALYIWELLAHVSIGLEANLTPKKGDSAVKICRFEPSMIDALSE